MDTIKIGQLIARLRKEKHMTQLQLAERLHISDKTVSKWERGSGCPDVSLLTELAAVFDVELEKLLAGELPPDGRTSGGIRKLRFYRCPHCGNLITAQGEASVSCCGKRLKALCPQQAAEGEQLSVSIVETDYFITAAHEMHKEHYISFVALLAGDALLLRPQYPEWELQVRLPAFAHGRLYWHCTRHGLFYQDI